MKSAQDFGPVAARIYCRTVGRYRNQCTAMTTDTLTGTTSPHLPLMGTCWRAISRGRKVAAALSIIIMCAALHLCGVVAGYIEEAAVTKAGASTALYMDGVIEPLVQDLVTESTLSDSQREALRRALSPSSIGKPLVGFRIWIGNRIVFSNHRELVGNRYPIVAARERAFAGEVVSGFGLDSEDDEEERALGVPILEVYAPIRRSGTHHIIAVAETSELAWDLKAQIRAAQYSSYILIVSVAATLVFVLLKFTGSLEGQLGTLGQRQLEETQRRVRLCRANRQLIEATDLNLRRIGSELQAKPLQHAALALLRLQSLQERSDEQKREFELVADAIYDCVTDLRNLSKTLALTQIETLSLTQILDLAVWLQNAQLSAPVICDHGRLPDDAPYALKACAFQLVKEGLEGAFARGVVTNIRLSSKCADNQLEIRLSYEPERPGSLSALHKQVETGCEGLQGRVEAMGGSLRVYAERHSLNISAAFNLRDMEIAFE